MVKKNNKRKEGGQRVRVGRRIDIAGFQQTTQLSQQNNLNEEMREKSKIKEYFYEDFERLSCEERDKWLGDQCMFFEQEVRHYFADREAFLEDFQRKLRIITKRWTSWNHRNFGAINSREQVKELSNWEKQNQPKIICGQSLVNNTTKSDYDPLEKFEYYCKVSIRLLNTFRQDIYRPLCDFFSDEETDSAVEETPKILEKCVQCWESLLFFSPINEKLFNKQLYGKGRTSDSELVIRLIPEIYEKQVEALSLARKWRLIVKSKDNQRRGTYTLTSATLEKREKMPRCRVYAISHDSIPHRTSGYFEELTKELNNAQEQRQQVKCELEESKRKCEKYEEDLEFCKKECENLKIELKRTSAFKKSLEAQISPHQSQSQIVQSQTAMSTLTEDEISSRESKWMKELDIVNIKYTQQKMKFLNAKKQIEGLTKQLDLSQKHCQQLAKNANDNSLKCKSLEEQLEVARKNIQTQGNMVDALQHQCYTLKQELDQSNIKKGDLYGHLSSTLERCKSMESDLFSSKQRLQKLEEESEKQKSRELLLEKENLKLKKIIESQNSNEKRRLSREETITLENQVQKRRTSRDEKPSKELLMENRRISREELLPLGNLNEKRRFSREDLSRENTKMRHYIEQHGRRRSNEIDYKSSTQLLKFRNSTQNSNNTPSLKELAEYTLPDINKGPSL